MSTPTVHPPPGAPPGGAAPQSPLAIVSVVFGGLAWVALPFLGALVAVITGHLAKREIRASAGRLAGSTLATVGLVLGYLQLVLGTVVLVALLTFLPRMFDMAAPTMTEFEEALPEPFPDEPVPEPAPAPAP